ncbi:MAG TPA: hypothetical protein VH702_10385 [Vicinamibacterales bacterium]|jgi:hypothetical protein
MRKAHVNCQLRSTSKEMHRDAFPVGTFTFLRTVMRTIPIKASSSASCFPTFWKVVGRILVDEVPDSGKRSVPPIDRGRQQHA